MVRLKSWVSARYWQCHYLMAEAIGKEVWGKGAPFGLTYARFNDLWGPLVSESHNFRSVAQKPGITQRGNDCQMHHIHIPISAAGLFSLWMVMRPLLYWSLRLGISAPNLIFSRIITANNSLLGKSNCCDFHCCWKSLWSESCISHRKSLSSHHVIKLRSNQMACKSVSFQKGFLPAGRVLGIENALFPWGV